MATSQIRVWDMKLKKYVYKTANVLENDYVKQQQAQKVLDGVNNIVKGNKNIADRMIADTRVAATQAQKQNTPAMQNKTASRPQNPVINSIADMLQTAANKKQNTGKSQAQNTFQLSSNPVEARKQLDTTVKQYQAVKPKEISVDDKIKQNLDRMIELANTDALSEDQKNEAKQYLDDIKGYYFKHIFDRKLGSKEDAQIMAIQNNLEAKSKAGSALGGGIISSVPFADALMQKQTEIADNALKGTNWSAESTGINYINPVEEAKKNNPAAYTAGDVIGNIAQLMGLGGAIKGGLTAAKLAPKLIEKGFGKQTANVISNLIVNEGLGAYSTAQEATKPGYDMSNLGGDFARNALLFGVTGSVGDVMGGALNSTVAKSGLTGLPKVAATIAAQGAKGLTAAAAGVGSTLPTYNKENMPSGEELLNQVMTLAIFNSLDGGEIRNDIAKKVSAPQSEYFKEIKTAEELKTARKEIFARYRRQQ